MQTTIDLSEPQLAALNALAKARNQTPLRVPHQASHVKLRLTHREPPMQNWSVTEEKIAEAVRRIVAAADPLQIIAFGSCARRDHRPDSDLDLALILDAPDEEVRQRLPQTVQRGLRMELATGAAGRFEAEDFLDSDGFGNKPVRIAVALTFALEAEAREGGGAATASCGRSRFSAKRP